MKTKPIGVATPRDSWIRIFDTMSVGSEMSRYLFVAVFVIYEPGRFIRLARPSVRSRSSPTNRKVGFGLRNINETWKKHASIRCTSDSEKCLSTS